MKNVEQSQIMAPSNQNDKDIDYIAQLLQIEADLTNFELQSAQSSLIYVSEQKPADYKIVKCENITQQEVCRAIAFNSDSTMMIASCNEKIKVFKFTEGQLKLLQVFRDNLQQVTALQFMKQSNQFISGNLGGFVQIWIADGKKSNRLSYLKGDHTSQVNQIIVNNDDNIIVSCCIDGSINSWQKYHDQWEFSQSYQGHKKSVYSLCFNESSNQLASCGSDNYILISYLGKDKLWKKMQKLQIEKWGYRICFVENNIIAFQPQNDFSMTLFKQSGSGQQFSKQKNIQLQVGEACYYFFPMIFNKQRNILVCKNGFNVNIMRKKGGEDIILEQIINFKCSYIFGALTVDGTYLITWDLDSYKFQVRKI